jgi:hypothetical protein
MAPAVMTVSQTQCIVCSGSRRSTFARAVLTPVPFSGKAATLGKRSVMGVALSAGTLALVPNATFASETFEPRMTLFSDRKNLFRLEYPADWEYVNKAGATLLLRDPTEKYAHIGVTMSPVKISSLAEFGTVHDIGVKLVKAEAAKESTVPGGVTLVSEGERNGLTSNITFYDYEYCLLTTHGNKRVFNSVAVHDNVLYIMNAQVRQKGENSEPDVVAALLRGVVATFDVGPAAT